jgi:hypothetical protein
MRAVDQAVQHGIGDGWITECCELPLISNG